MPSPGVLTPAYPPPFPTNVKSLRFYVTGTADASFATHSYAFERPDPKDPSEPEQGWCTNIRVIATTGDIQISFDGTNVHGFIPSGSTQEYWDRHEGGIAIRGAGTFHVEAW